MTDADAKKKKVYVPAALKLTSKGKESTMDFVGDSTPPTEKGKTSGLQKPSVAPKSAAGAKQPSAKNLGTKQDPIDESDPIDVAISARKAAGATDTVIMGMDAKKKKLQIPRPLNLKIANEKKIEISFISAAAAEEEKKANATKEDTK